MKAVPDVLLTLFGAELHTQELRILGELELPKWKALLRSLAFLERGRQFWIGDALVYGEKVFAEELFVQHSSEVGLEPKTLVNYRWVASRVEPGRRRAELSFSHHDAIARLKPKEQDALLERAIRNSWGVHELRAVVAIEHPENGSQGQLLPDDTDPPPSLEAATQRRLERIEAALKDEGLEGVTADDVAWLLELAKRLTRGTR